MRYARFHKKGRFESYETMKGDSMETREITRFMTNGLITYRDREDVAGEIPWSQHPKFKGVYLKHLIKGTDTGGMLSCHMVRIDPHAILEEHVHADQWELHEIIDGEGSFTLESKEVSYHAGSMAIIPKGSKHKVVAGSGGLIILAKFFPALI